MSGRRGKRLIPIAMTMAILLQLCPMSWLASEAQSGFNTQLQGLGLDVPMPKPVSRAKAPASNTATPQTALRKSTDGDEVYTMQQLDDNDKGLTTGKTLQGTVTSIHVTNGRSQIIKFAQPIMRLSIADPKKADIIPLAPDQIMLNGKERGVTSLIVWDENGQEGIFDLYVQNDSSELLDAVNAIAPNEKIQARVTDDSFILSGQVSNTVILDEIRKTAAAYGYRDDKFIDLTDTPVPQVMLEVKIAEANRSVGRQLKTSFQTSSPNKQLNLIRLANPIDSSLLGAVTRSAGGMRPDKIAGVGNLAVAQAGGNTGGVTGSMFLGHNLQMMWDMLETSGKINTLANPTLVCTHGREASFLAGGEFPFVGSVDQNGSPVISFKEFGVKLKFTPWIAVQSGRIELKVSPEVSNLDSSNCVAGAAGTQVCGILKRTTDTTVDLMDGETLMISGILTREEQNTFNKVPFIGNVPILGNAFKNGNMSKTDRELVVIITPHIVKPTDYGKVLGAAAD